MSKLLRSLNFNVNDNKYYMYSLRSLRRSRKLLNLVVCRMHAAGRYVGDIVVSVNPFKNVRAVFHFLLSMEPRHQYV